MVLSAFEQLSASEKRLALCAIEASCESRSGLMAELKSEVNADNNLTVEEKQAVKIGISVPAYSSEYWLPVEYGGNGKGYAFLVKASIRQGNGTSTLAQARASGGHIAASDAVGGCVGGIGFCISAYFGPVGVGAYAFALGFGAASASLCTWAGL